jgi:hypothetical protein
MQSFSFGSVSGSTFAFYLFLLFAILIGTAIYGILLQPQMRNLFRLSRPRLQALAIGGGVALLVILGFYFSSLDGFYRLETSENGQEIRLEYILPRRSLALRRSAVAEARRTPSYKGLWQLVLYTPTGAKFSSARADYASIRKAWEYLNTRLDLQPKIVE